MTRALPAASAISLLLHLGALALLGLWFATRHFAAFDTLPVLSLELLSQPAGRIDTPTTEASADEAEATAVPLPREEQPSGSTGNSVSDEQYLPSTEQLSSREQPSAIPSIAADGEPTPEPAMISGPPATDQGLPASTPVTTTGPSSVQAVTTAARGSAAPQTQELTRRERRMLDRRIERLMRKLERLSPTDPALEWTHRGRTYRAELQRSPATTDTALEEVRVRVSTDDNGKQLSTEMTLRRLAFSSFGQFVNRWDPQVLIHDDIIDGRFHSNSDVALSYSRQVRPVFNDKVTIAGTSIKISESQGHVRRDEMFRGGLKTGVRSIPLPRRFSAATDEVEPGRIHRFSADTRIEFRRHGVYGWYSFDDGRRGQRRLTDDTFYMLAAEGVRLHVRGVVNGKVLVHAPRGIVIEDDLVYANDPRFDPRSDDYLGLVSDRSVEVAGPELTGPGGLEIHAAIFAGQGFRVRNHRVGNNDLLYLHGSLTVGFIDATEPRYRTRVEFDPRFETARPPAFPVTGHYEMVDWDGQWQVGD